MPDEYYIAAAAILLIETMAYIYLLDKLLTRRFNLNIIIIILVTFVFQNTKYISDYQGIRLMMACFSDYISMFVFYKDKMRDSFIYPVIFYDLMLICDGVTVSVFWLMGRWNFRIVEYLEHSELIMSIASRILLPVLVYIFLKLWPKGNGKKTMLYPLPIFIYIVQIAFFPFDESSLYRTRPEWLYVLVCSFIVISMACFVIAERNRRKREEYAAKLKELEIHRSAQLGYIHEIQNSYKGMAAYAHDMKHHLNLLNTFILSGEPDRAREYIQTALNAVGEAFISYTGNADVDSIIHSKRLNCLDNISFSVTGKLPSEIEWLDTADICILLANALSNAIEACASLPSSVIDIEFVYRDWLIISVENPYAELPERDRNGSYISKKGMGHGLGIKSMEAVCKKYGGHLNAETNGNRFIIEMLLSRPN